jgi:hypothetical protein
MVPQSENWKHKISFIPAFGADRILYGLIVPELDCDQAGVSASAS